MTPLLKLLVLEVKQSLLTNECDLLLTSHPLRIGVLRIELLLEHLNLPLKQPSMILILIDPLEEEFPLLGKLLSELIELSKLFFLVPNIECPHLLDIIYQKLMSIGFFFIGVIFIKICHILEIPVIFGFSVIKERTSKDLVKFFQVYSGVMIFYSKLLRLNFLGKPKEMRHVLVHMHCHLFSIRYWSH